jgi:hypothetical protein
MRLINLLLIIKIYMIIGTLACVGYDRPCNVVNGCCAGLKCKYSCSFCPWGKCIEK